MNPAFSVIFFTTASGVGYGMLALVGLLAPLHILPQQPWFGVTAIGLSLGLSTMGLLSSTWHLGRPERAWRAMSQWKTSWLSREGVAALLTYVPSVLFGLVWWSAGHPSAWLGVPAAAMAIITVYCTAMIYASLRPIRQWCHPLVLPIYLAFAAFSGLVCLAAVAGFWQAGALRLMCLAALVFGAAALALKLLYWRSIDRAVPVSTTETATGLGHLGTVRLLDAPHTGTNYLLREMGFRVARKHAAKLRRLSLVAIFALPGVLMCVALALPPLAALGCLLLTVVLVLGGVFLERWLFFAQATHTVGLYYGIPS